MVPDAVYSLLCGVVCALNALNGAYWSTGMCNFQQLFIVWGVGSNMLLNAAVSHQLHTMLRNSGTTQRYSVPTNRFVTKQALAIYLFTAFVGTWGFIESSKFPYYVASTSGLACLPVEQDWQSSIFFWVVFFPLFGGIPMLYIHYVIYDVWKKGLMPPAGKRRLLAIYFGRIVVVFVLCWVPYMVLVFMFATWMPTEVHFYGGTLSHLQGVISAGLCLLKPDVYFAVKRFFSCRCRQKEDDQDADRSSPRWRFSFSSRLTRLSGGSAKVLRRPDKEFAGPRNGSSTNESTTSVVGNVVSSRPNISSVSQLTESEVDEAADTDTHDIMDVADNLWPNENGEYPVVTSEATGGNSAVAGLFCDVIAEDSERIEPQDCEENGGQGLPC